MLRVIILFILFIPVVSFSQTCSEVQFFAKEALVLFKNIKGKALPNGEFESKKSFGGIKGTVAFDVGCLPMAMFYRDTTLLYEDALKQVAAKKAIIINCLSADKKWKIVKNEGEVFRIRKNITGMPGYSVDINVYVAGDYNKNIVYTYFAQNQGCPE